MLSIGGKSYRSTQVRSVISMPPPPPEWVAPTGATEGYCELQGPGLGDCEVGDQGSWPGVSTPAECIARCGGCARCRFVSFTLANATEGTVDREGGLRVRKGKARRRYPPYWWRCRWYHHCDLDDLRRSPPAGEPWQYVTLRPPRSYGPHTTQGSRSSAARASQPRHHATWAEPDGQSSLSLAVATTFELRFSGAAPVADDFVASREHTGGFVQWCQNARRLQGLLPPSWRMDQLVISTLRDAHTHLARLAGCTKIKHRRVSRELSSAAAACQPKIYRSYLTFLMRTALFKWQLFAMTDYDVVLFSDVDVELVPLADTDPKRAAASWNRLISRFARTAAPKLLANSDVASPFNAGVMFIRPSRRLFAEGLAVVRSCRFNKSHGWELAGVSPAAVAPNPYSLHTKAAPWDFVGAGSDQGLYLFMGWVRHPGVGEYGRPAVGDTALFCRHWWTNRWGTKALPGGKPWRQAYQLGTNLTAEALEPDDAAPLYDFLVRYRDDGEASRAAGTPPALLASAQRQARRMIESQPSFADTFQVWQKQAWKGGFAPHFPIPRSARD